MSKHSSGELKKELLGLETIDTNASKDSHYKTIFDSMSEMVEVIELIYDENKQPIDFYIRDINNALAKLLNRTKEQLINKKMSSVVGVIEDSWLTSFANVDNIGKPISFKNYGAEFDNYYFVNVWKVSKNRIGVSFTDITLNEKAEITLKENLIKEKKEKEKAEKIIKEKSVELQNTIEKLAVTNYKLSFQHEEKDKWANDLANIKIELEQQVFCLNESAIVSEADANGNIIFVNDKFCKISGYQREELIGKNHRLLKSGKQPEGVFVGMWAAISSGRVWKGTIMNKKKGGKEFYWVDTTIMPFKDLNGKIIKYVGIRFDVTYEVNQQEILLKQAKELVAQNKDKDERAEELTFQNKEKEKRAKELILVNTELAFQNEEKDKRANELILANKEKDKRSNELIHANKEKDKRANELTLANKEKGKRANELDTANSELAFQNKEKDKRASELILANKELDFQNKEKEKRADELILANTELAFQNEEKDKRANELILANKEKEKRAEELAIAKELRQFIETANTPIFGIDSNGLINEWNHSAEAVTGYKKAEALGTAWRKFTPKNYLERIKKILENVLIGEPMSNFEFAAIAKNGEQVMLLVNTSTRRDAVGNVTGVLAVGQNITKLVGYRNELEVKVDERTLKLNKALKKEKELNKLKSNFVSTTSHEFRTPLSAINFAAGAIKKYWAKMEPDMIEKKLHKIEDQVLHMTRLLDDILIFGQAEESEIRQNPTHMNFGEFMNEITEEVYSSFNNTHEIILIDTEELKSTDIFIDEKLGRNIFTNILSNAVKYSPDANKITIALSSEKNYTVVSITDYGIGISKSELKNIFTPFSRGENVDLIQGTGLGLSIVKQTLEVIKGKIKVHSTIGNGTTFVVKLPKNK